MSNNIFHSFAGYLYAYGLYRKLNNMCLLIGQKIYSPLFSKNIEKVVEVENV